MKHYLTRVTTVLPACVGALPAIAASTSETCLLCNFICVRIWKRKLFNPHPKGKSCTVQCVKLCSVGVLQGSICYCRKQCRYLLLYYLNLDVFIILLKNLIYFLLQSAGFSTVFANAFPFLFFFPFIPELSISSSTC